MGSGRNSYHHGDLRRSLIDEGLALTRSRGPRALGLRAVTRQVGVSANAAYRHFANQQALVAAVAGEILEKMAAQMREFIATDLPPDPREQARHRLRAVGLGYITFAVSEPGWFETAFFGTEMSDRQSTGSDDHDETPERHETASDDHDETPEHYDEAPPFALLVEALDGMVAAGVLSAERRPGAEWSCWSTVHGFAELVVHGPLRQREPAEVMTLAARVIEDVIAGIR